LGVTLGIFIRGQKPLQNRFVLAAAVATAAPGMPINSRARRKMRRADKPYSTLENNTPQEITHGELGDCKRGVSNLLDESIISPQADEPMRNVPSKVSEWQESRNA
jgi:hypothetical protein